MNQTQTKAPKEKFISPEFKSFFLLEFTKELIKNSASSEVLELVNVLKEEAKEEKFRVKQIVTENKKIQKKHSILPKRLLFKPRRAREIRPRILHIPEPRLPERLSYIKPTSTEVQIDLGKLNPLIKDSAVKIIECEGSNKNIMVGGAMGRKKTSIVLNAEEINEIIENFSKISKIPTTQGIFKVAVGKFVLSAIISDVVDSRFIIKKIAPQKSNLIPSRFRKS
ncbi:hypothetical protein KAR52_02445 [Candidatus Pacearchaeota archaeon]|nr:hypothetical protein [Candidatus Pacearchaeota archaeon]